MPLSGSRTGQPVCRAVMHRCDSQSPQAFSPPSEDGWLSSTFPRSEPGRCRQSRATKRGEGRSAPCSPRWVGVPCRLRPTAPRAQPVGRRHPLSPSRTRADVPEPLVGRPVELTGSSTQPWFGLPVPEATLMGRLRRFGTRGGHPARSYRGPCGPPSSRRLESQVGRY